MARERLIGFDSRRLKPGEKFVLIVKWQPTKTRFTVVNNSGDKLCVVPSEGELTQIQFWVRHQNVIKVS